MKLHISNLSLVFLLAALLATGLSDGLYAQTNLETKEVISKEQSTQTEINFTTPPPLPRAKPKFKVWTSQEIEQARETCKKVLGKWEIKAQALPAIADYDGCGDAAPLLVSQIYTKINNRTVPVSISPPATLNCNMTDKIALWLNNNVQKTAQEFFTQPVTTLHNVASYHCRKRYNALVGKMSEHAFANALDISSFSLEDGTKIGLLKHWLKTPPASKQKEDNNKTTHLPKPITAANAKPMATETPEQNKEAVESIFLKTIHEKACGHFSTVLGPEANAAHADHFHLDLGRGGRYQICE